MSYTMPVKKGRIGLKFRQKASIWPWGHPGVDILPEVPRSPQSVEAAQDGIFIQNVGGACQGFDWKDSEGKYHRYCHVERSGVKFGSFKKGETIGKMVNKGFIVPPGATHLHWVVALDRQFRKQLDPLSLDFDGKPLISKVNAIFRDVWQRQPQKKESCYFQKRVDRGITAESKLREVMHYWHGRNRFAFIIEMQKWGCF